MTNQHDYPPSPRSALKRLPERGHHERQAVHAILDEGLVAHVGFATGEQPFVIPTAYVRLGETLYLHGSPASRMLRSLGKGIPVCVTVTHLDGLVFARSAFHHSDELPLGGGLRDGALRRRPRREAPRARRPRRPRRAGARPGGARAEREGAAVHPGAGGLDRGSLGEGAHGPARGRRGGSRSPRVGRASSPSPSKPRSPSPTRPIRCRGRRLPTSGGYRRASPDQE